MKRGAPDHPKFRLLASKLGLRRYQVVGIMESLYHFAASYAKRGDIGKWSDEEIATALDWEQSPQELIEALVACKLLDRCNSYRLVVHDWKEHADQTVLRSDEVKKLGFASITLENASQPTPTPTPTPEPVASAVELDFEKIRPLVGIQFQGKRTEAAVRSWFKWVSSAGKPPFDPNEQATRLIQLFCNEDDLCFSVKKAIGNRWTTLQNYASPRQPGNDAPPAGQDPNRKYVGGNHK